MLDVPLDGAAAPDGRGARPRWGRPRYRHLRWHYAYRCSDRCRCAKMCWWSLSAPVPLRLHETARFLESRMESYNVHAHSKRLLCCSEVNKGCYSEVI